jgi:GxxExxY protein
VRYGEIEIEAGLRLDILVDDKIILELKSAEKMIPLYDAQLLTYLKLTGLRLGFLINFNVSLFKEGIKRLVI